MEISKENNFDLIRLICAFQVFVYHGSRHLMLISSETLWLWLNQFPGVPIFFFISGYLITASYERNHGQIWKYVKNRFLRIYPALWVCFLVTFLLLCSHNYINLSSSRQWLWIFAQVSFLQYYKIPDFKTFGMGHPNGSLWSIVVELQFYLVLPFICILLARFSSLKQKNLILLALMAISFVLGLVFDSTTKNTLIFDQEYLLALQENKIMKFFGTSVIWNFYYFGIGMLFFYNKNLLIKYTKGYFWYWLALYIVYILIFVFGLKLYFSPHYYNIYGLLALVILAFLTFSAAYTNPGLSNRLLKGNDISYGIYIYHMPIINYGIDSQSRNYPLLMLISIIIVSILAILSWRFVEKPALNLKYK